MISKMKNLKVVLTTLVMLFVSVVSFGQTVNGAQIVGASQLFSQSDTLRIKTKTNGKVVEEQIVLKSTLPIDEKLKKAGKALKRSSNYQVFGIACVIVSIGVPIVGVVGGTVSIIGSIYEKHRAGKILSDDNYKIY